MKPVDLMTPEWVGAMDLEATAVRDRTGQNRRHAPDRLRVKGQGEAPGGVLPGHRRGGVKPWRLPMVLLGFLDPRTRFQAGNPSGVRLRFASSRRRIVLEVEPDAAGHPLMSRRYVELVWPRLKALADSR